MVDVLYDGREFHVFPTRRLPVENPHGTGCTLSAAIVAGLARGRNLPAAVGDAVAYVHRAIEMAPGLGRGRGPLNHFLTPAATPESP
jgi:hydroxymethylpyrimidine/phosphomethylpyrimidine kinase